MLDQFHRAEQLVRILIGPLGSGKTFAALNEITRLCHTQVPNKQDVRKSRWCIARNSTPDLLATTIPDARTILDKINPNGWNMSVPITWNHSYKRVDGTTVEMQVMFRAFDVPGDVKKARGMQLTGVWVDELAEFDKANFDMLIGRVRRYPSRAEVPQAEFDVLATSNACAKDHWLAKIAVAPKALQPWWIGVQPGGVLRLGNKWVVNLQAENLANLHPGYYIDQCANKKESWIRQNLANEFVSHSDGRAVHPDFSERLHVSPCAPTPGIDICLGFDFGRTPAGVVLQRQPNGQIYVLKEVVTYNMGAKQFGTIFRKMLNKDYNGFMVGEATGDPSGDDMAQTDDETPMDMLEESQIYCLPASTNDPAVRYESLDSLLRTLIEGEPAIIIDPECEVLISGLAGAYQFRRIQVTGREEYRDKPDKGATSHVCEALHYALMGMGEGEIQFDQGSNEVYDNVESWAPRHSYYE